LERAGGSRFGFGGAFDMPRRSWCCGLQRDGDRAEQAVFGTGCGEGQADTRDGFGDAGAELKEPEPQSGELSFAELVGFGHRVAQREH
jgi:hypothetical protein